MRPLLLLGLLLPLPGPGSLPHAAPAPRHASEEREATDIERALALLRGAARAEAPDAGRLARDLVAAGDGAVPLLFAVLDTGVLPTDQPGGSVAEVPPPFKCAVWVALGRSSEEAVRRHVASMASPDVPERRRGTALRVLGATGGASDLALLARLASPEGARPPSDALRADLVVGLNHLLEREPSSIRWIDDLFGGVHPALWTTVLEAITASRAPDAPAVLAGLLGNVPDADPLVLREISRLARSGLVIEDEYVLGRVRDYLDAVDGSLVRSAAETAGRLADEAAVPRLVDLLHGGDRTVHPIARLALTRITGRDFGSDGERWDQWYREELRFWREESHAWIAALRSPEPTDVVEAISRLGGRALYRHEIARALLGVLDRSEPGLRRLACAALGRLGSPGARPDLEDLLHDPDEGVRAAARAALDRLDRGTVPER